MERKSVELIFLTFVILIFAVCSSVGQEKVEREFSVDEDQVPSAAVRWVLSAFPEAKVKWFYEETSGSKSYEAKLKWDEQDHSIEFDTTGILEDVEIKVDWENLPEDTRKGLERTLQNEDVNFKIRKIQKQLTGNPNHIILYIQGDPGVEITLRYEIEYFSTSNDKFNLWEGLFSINGMLLSKRKVKLMTTDNLDF